MEKKKYYLVSAEALPEVFIKVAEAKRMLQVGEADTVGEALPWGARAIVRFVRGALDEAGFQGVRINWHGHSDRGMALPNCFAAIEGGADVVLDIIGGAYLQRNVDVLRTGGRIVTIGLQGGRTGELNLGTLLAKRASITATALRSRPATGRRTAR